MAVNVVLNGVTYTIPDPGDTSWGQNLTDYFVAQASGLLQKAGGSFTLTAEVDFGATYGLKSAYFKSRAAAPASAGQIRLGNLENISWRNADNDGNLSLSVDADGNLTFDGVAISFPSGSLNQVLTWGSGPTWALLTNSNLSGSAAISNANLATMANNTVKGNVSGGAAVPSDLTATQLTTLVNAFVGDAGAGGTKGAVPAPASGDAAAGKFLKADGTWEAPAGSGTVTSVTFTGDGTVLSNTPSAAVTTSGTVSATLNTQTARTFLSGPLSGAAATPTFKALTVPSIQKFTATGTTTGYVFTISTSTTCSVGDTYTNNGNTYTVLAALAGVTGQVMFMSGAAAPQASGTLTRATGAGTASVTYTLATALATYTAPTGPSPLYIRVRMVGGGGGGGGGGTAGQTVGNTGTASYFGPRLLSANGGSGGAQGNTGGGQPAGGAGGDGSLGTGPIGTKVQGEAGAPGWNMIVNQYAIGGAGGATPLGGRGNGVFGGATGGAAVANTGSGGQGGGVSVGNGQSGAGGGAAGFVDAIITSPSSTYVYAIGSAGSGGGLGTNGGAGGAGAAGYIEVTEYYQ